MKIFLVSYATPEFEKRQKELEESAKRYGFDEFFSYKEKDIIDTDFFNKNKRILKKKRGAGYWIWKPYLILKSLKSEKVEERDVLVYVDTGVEVVNDVGPLVSLCKEKGGTLLFNAVNKNVLWTKRDCFVKMNCDNKKYWEHHQFMGGYQVYEKNKKNIDFIEEYLKFVQIPHLIDDSKSFLSNFKGFIEHRHDQSILTNLAIKYGIKGFRNPSQGGNHLKKPELRVKGEYLNHPYSENYDEESDYPQIFFNKRNASKFRLFLIKLKNKLRWLT